MDRIRWERIQQLFEQAVAFPPGDDRDRFLQGEEPDPELRAEVRALLEADQRPDTPPPLAAIRQERSGSRPEASGGPPPLEGRQVGPYRVLRRIGEGGMGAVYLAERQDVDKRVALKLVRGALASPELVQRFLRERRVLARLEHPNIARLLDAGMTPDETPFFAMEYVEGAPITDHCRAVSASPEAVLRLFLSVCDAVEHAHRGLIVHRDLKPSNVMVDRDGRVKLLDFGIAKLLDEDVDDTLTRTGVRVMSPAYAAPEQLRGEPVTTGTDIYALGVLLSELLTGDRVPRSGTALPQDVEAICLKAAAPEPDRRYGSVRELAADVTRYLEGRPVQARLPTLAYRAGKFLRRHAAAVSVTAVILLAVGGGLGAALWQGQRASRALGEAETARADAEVAREEVESALARSRTVTDFVLDLFDAADPRVARGATVTAFDLLDRGVEQADQLEDPLLRAELLHALAAVDLQLGRYERAGDLMARAVPIRREHGSPDDVVSSLNVWGRTFSHRGLPDSAAVAWAEAIAVGDSTLGPDHGNVRAARQNLAIAYGRLGRDDEAEAILWEVIEAERRALEPNDPDRGYPLNSLGLQLTNRGAYDEAEPLLRESHRIWQAVEGPHHPISAMVTDNLGMMLREAGRYDEAEPLMREAMATRREILGEGHRFFGESLFSLGTLLALRARPADLTEADSLLHRGLDLFIETLGPEHPGTAYILHSLGILAESQGDPERAERRYREALEIRRGSSRDSPMVTVRTLTALASLLRREGDPEALGIAREAAALATERLAPDHPVRGQAEAELGLAELDTTPGQGRDRVLRGIVTVVDRIGALHPTARGLCAAAADYGVVVEVCGVGG